MLKSSLSFLPVPHCFSISHLLFGSFGLTSSHVFSCEGCLRAGHQWVSSHKRPLALVSFLAFSAKPIEQRFMSFIELVRQHCRKWLFRGNSTFDACSPKSKKSQGPWRKLFFLFISYFLVWSVCLLFVEWLKRSHFHVYFSQMEENFLYAFIQLCSYTHFYFNQKLSWSEWRPPLELVYVFKSFVYHSKW